jgi:sugar-specific transcriptional regulator TrmB/hemerythrin-like domain-containing protein
MLSDFGLTVNQAKIYLAIAKSGLTTISHVSKVSQVRREDVYRALPKLEKMGLIERVLGAPTQIRAIPINDALDILVKHERSRATQKVADLAVKKEEFLRNFHAINRRTMIREEETLFSLTSEKAAILGKMISPFKNAQSEIDVVSSRQKISQFMFAYPELFEAAAKKGVKIRIITEMPEEEGKLPRMMEDQIASLGTSVRLRFAETLPSHFMIFDNRELMLSTSTEGALAESPSLWTNSVALVEPLQRTFENLWSSSVNWTDLKTETTAEKVTRFIKQLKPSDHVILVCENPETKYQMLFSYIKLGLDEGESTLYVCSEAKPTQIRHAMKLSGIDVEKHENAGALTILPYNEFYIIDGKFSTTNTLSRSYKLYKEALTSGFKGLRVACEMACFFKHNMVQELVDYEKALHRILEIPIVTLCCYPADRLKYADDPNLYGELVRAHGTVVFAGRDPLGRIEIISLLSKDHYEVLRKIQLFEEVALSLFKKEMLKEGAPGFADDFLEFFKLGLSEHFQMEEKILFPVLKDTFPPEEHAISKLAKEHKVLLQKYAKIQKLNQKAGLKTQVTDFLAYLTAHARTEEDLFPLLIERLDRKRLRKIGSTVKRLGYPIQLQERLLLGKTKPSTHQQNK